MFNILVIGMTGQGKSPLIQSYIAGRKCFVFDVNNEYGYRTKYKGQKPVGLSDNIFADRARQVDFNTKRFILNCLKKTDTVCVFEEATIFFKGNTFEELRHLMLSKLFNRNVNIFVFHAIRPVPPDIMSYVNYVVLFKTVDEDYQVKGKYPSLYPYYEQLKSMPRGSKIIIQTIEQ